MTLFDTAFIYYQSDLISFNTASEVARVEFYLQIQKLLITLIKCSFVY